MFILCQFNGMSLTESGDTIAKMSKAFTRESDDLPDLPLVARQASPLPPGASNYITPEGAQRLQNELDRLIHIERAAVASVPDDALAKPRLQALDQRIQQLQESLHSAQIVPSPTNPDEGVRFGATVTVKERSGSEIRYRIVGVDELDFDEDAVSWISPIARGLLHARVGERVLIQLPAGEEELEIVSVTYSRTAVERSLDLHE